MDQFAQQLDGHLPERLDFKAKTHPQSWSQVSRKYKQHTTPSLLDLAQRLLEHEHLRTNNKCLSLLGVLQQSVAHSDLAVERYKKYEHLGTSIIGSRITRLFAVQGHLNPVFSVLFDLTASRFVTGGDDNLVKIWCAKTGWLIKTLRAHQSIDPHRGSHGVIVDLCLHNSNKMLGTCSSDRTIRIWRFDTFEPMAFIPVGKEITSLSFSNSPDPMNQCIIATCADAKARVYMWNKETENFVTEPVVLESGTLVKDTVDCLATHYTGLFFATGGRDGCVYLYSMLPDHPMPDCLPKILKIFPAHRGRINDLRFSHRGNRLVSGSKDGRVVVFDIGLETKCLEIKTAEEKRGIVEESEKYLMDPNATASNTRPLEITSVAFNLDDTRIVTASIDHVIRVFDAFTGQAYHELRGHTAKVFMTEAHPKDKRIVLTAGHDGSVFLWDIYKGRSIFTVTQEETILGATFSPEGDQFLVSDFRGIVTVYGLETFEYHVPLEQFFLSDWYTVKEDLMGNLICEDTQLPGHLVEPGEVVTMGRDTYPESIYSRPDYFPYPYELEQSMVRERMGDLKEQLRLDRKLIQHLKQKRSEPKTINKKVLTKRRRQDFVESDEEDAPPPILFLPPEEPMIQIPQESSGDEYGAEENADEGDDASFDEPVFDEFDLQSDQQPEGEEFVQSTTRQQRFEKRSRLRSSSPEGSEEQLNLRKRKISSFAEDYDSDMFDESELLLPEPSERKIVKKRLKLPARTSVQPWIAQDTPQFTPYLPQMHDKVFYIKAGHEEFSQKVDDYKRIVVNPHLPEIVLGEIVSIQYKLNPMLICQIELAMFDGLELPAEYDPQKLQKVKIQWFDWNDVPDFIILYDLYLHGRKQVFEPGDIVMARYENGDVEAKIESVGEQEWAKYTVSFEGFEEQLKFNPWELRRKEDKFPDLPSLDQESSKNLLGIVQGVASEPLFEAFVPEIPYDIFPEYLSMIPYPICIQLILNRLFNGFYRSLFQLIWDWDTMCQNCIDFNGDGSYIAQLAGDLYPIRDELLGLKTAKRRTSHRLRRVESQDRATRRRRRQEESEEEDQSYTRMSRRKPKKRVIESDESELTPFESTDSESIASVPEKLSAERQYMEESESEESAYSAEGSDF